LNPASLFARVYIPFACGYYVSYVFRNVNASIYRDLVGELGLQAADLGLLTSAYLFVFAGAQLPIGVLLDRFGPRRVNAALLVAAAAGSLAFSLGRSTTELVVARALIGLGVSACLMAAMQALSIWFPLDRLPRLNGLMMAIGGLGAMTATAPVSAAIALFGWRGLFALLAGVSLAVAVLVFRTVPERERGDAPAATLAGLVRGLAGVLKSGYFWRVTVVCSSTLGPAIALQGLWAGPWLHDVLGLDRAAAASELFLLTVALTAGFLLSGKLADWGRRAGLRLRDVFLLTSLVSALALGAIALGLGGMPFWMVYIFASAGAALAYPVLAERFPGHITGRVNASLNMVTFVTAFGVQYAVGVILDAWGAADGRYPRAAYDAAFGCVALVQFVAVALFLPLLRRPVLPAAAGERAPGGEHSETGR